MSGKYFWITFGGIINKTGAMSHLTALLPSGSYNTQANALADVNATKVREFSTLWDNTGFLIAETLFRHQPAASGTWTEIETNTLLTITGGTGGGGTIVDPITSFSDAIFDWFNSADPTKIVDVDLSALTTATTRTLDIQDADGIIALINAGSIDPRYVAVIGDIMTGPLQIQVPTAITEALILKTTDDDTTKNLIEIFKADGTTYLISLTAGGRLGIGTGSPDELLHVSGGNILLDNVRQIRIKDAGGTENNVLTLTSAAYTDELILGAGSGIDNLSLATGGIRRLFINNSGKVTIQELELASGTTVNDIDTAMAGSPTDDQLLTAQGISEAILAGGGGVTGTVLLAFNARLTLTTGESVPTADVSNATEIYITSHDGDRLTFYNGSTWDTIELDSDVSILITHTMNGDTHNGTKVIDNLAESTSQLIPGMIVTGTGVGVGAVIDTVDSDSQITVDVNSTADGTVAITSKVLKNTMVDIFAFNDSGTAKLEMVSWATKFVRATAITQVDGIDVKTGDTSRRLVGSVAIDISVNGVTHERRTFAAGQPPFRGVSNRYNRVMKEFEILEATDSWVYAVAAIRAWNNTTTNRVIFANCIDRDPVLCMFGFGANASAVGNISLNGFGAKDNAVTGWAGPAGGNATAVYYDKPGLGLNFLGLTEYAFVASTIFGDAGAPTAFQMGATGHVWG
ncbi:MAG TPA: hypothetical protein ENI05_03170 [Porticoccus sp.]|nr:hypothetical protein [Porticoccus sp.]